MRPLPDYGDLMPIDEFVGAVRDGYFIDYDGHGEYAMATEVSDIRVKPSHFYGEDGRTVDDSKVDRRFTHVLWYNR